MRSERAPIPALTQRRRLAAHRAVHHILDGWPPLPEEDLRQLADLLDPQRATR